MRTIPYVTPSDVARWEEVLNRIEPTIATDIAEQRLQKGRRIAQHFRNRINSGLLAYSNGDTFRALHDFNEAVSRFMLFFDPKYADAVDLSHVFETSAEVLEVVLIVNAPCLTTISQKLQPLHVASTDPRSAYVRAVSSLIVSDRKSAVTEATVLRELNAGQFGSAIPAAILAIARGCPNNFLANVQSALNDFDGVCRSEARGTPEAVIFLRGVALIHLYERSNGEAVSRSGLDIRLMPE